MQSVLNKVHFKQELVEILGRDGSNPLRGDGGGFRLVRLGDGPDRRFARGGN